MKGMAAAVCRELPQFSEQEVEAAIPLVQAGKSITKQRLVEGVRLRLESHRAVVVAIPERADDSAVRISAEVEASTRSILRAYSGGIGLQEFRAKWACRISAIIEEFPFHYALHRERYEEFERLRKRYYANNPTPKGQPID